MKNKYNIIGVMSGSSMDGLDIAFCQFEKIKEQWKFKILEAATYPFQSEIKESLKKIHSLNAEEYVRLDVKFGEFIGEQVNKFINDNKTDQPEFIASHGHTAFHNPNERYTGQIGNGASIAAVTKIPTISDFRTLDVALGGQGAPLVPIGDRLLFGEFSFCLNLGGYSNISYEKDEARIAFDICPVNKAINYLANQLDKEMDYNGEIAKHGRVDDKLLKDLNSLEFYRQNPPKSLGDHWLRNKFLPVINNSSLSIPNILRTVYEHIAIQIAAATKDKSNESILVTGGGTHNHYLAECIKKHNQNSIFIPENLLIDYKEALIFAFMGILRINNQMNCLSSVTGAQQDCSGGIIHLI